MANLMDLDSRDQAGNLRIVVEAPKGSIAKLKYNPRLEAFELQRFIADAGYPYDWGFVPSTLAADGDPLDAMVLHHGHTWPGVIIPSVAIALLRLTESKAGESESKRNDRLIAVPVSTLARGTASELTSPIRDSLEKFFVATGELAKKRVSIEGWGDEAEALAALSQAAQAYSWKAKRANG